MDLKGFENRLRKNMKHLRPWAAREGIEAFRVYDGDISEHPYLVDRYGDAAVLWVKGVLREEVLAMEEEKLDIVGDMTRAVLDLPEDALFIKRRRRQQGESQYEKLAGTGVTRIVREGPCRFKVNLSDYLDTGLFLDHRPLRKRLREESAGKRLLNLFSYTGSVTVAAGLGGARVTSVDMSNTYLDWARENAALNGLDPAALDFIRADCLQWLVLAPKPIYDVVFLDPPSFSNSKKMRADSFDVQRDQIGLVEASMKWVKPGGFLLFSNNRRGFKLAQEIGASFAVEDISTRTIPQDFKDKRIHNCFEIRAR